MPDTRAIVSLMTGEDGGRIRLAAGHAEINVFTRVSFRAPIVAAELTTPQPDAFRHPVEELFAKVCTLVTCFFFFFFFFIYFYQRAIPGDIINFNVF